MNLRDWDSWNDNYREIDSVHFLGAAQDNECVTPEWGYERYNGIEYETAGTFNYWNSEDDVLSTYFNTYEVDQALGESGAEDGKDVPSNYWDFDMTSEVGDDHSAYLENCADEVEYHMWYADNYL